jgi:hypothetical protein
MGHVARSRDGDIARAADPYDCRGVVARLGPPTRNAGPAVLDAYRNEVDAITRSMTDQLNRQLFAPTTTIDRDGAIAQLGGADMPATTHTSTQALHARRARLEAELARIDARLEAYGDDIYEIGSVLVWDKTFVGLPDKVYSYAALRTALGWYVTGRTASTGMTWDALVDFIIDDAVTVPTLYCVTELAEHEPGVL